MVVILKIYIAEYSKEFDIFIGRNKDENTVLIKKSSLNDIWFHLDKVSGPHIILSTEGCLIPKRILNYIGSIFRDYKNNLPSRYTVIYTFIKNVKLTKVPGTVIPSNTKKIKY